jgi:hypothetical protein
VELRAPLLAQLRVGKNREAASPGKRGIERDNPGLKRAVGVDPPCEVKRMGREKERGILVSCTTECIQLKCVRRSTSKDYPRMNEDSRSVR